MHSPHTVLDRSSKTRYVSFLARTATMDVLDTQKSIVLRLSIVEYSSFSERARQLDIEDILCDYAPLTRLTHRRLGMTAVLVSVKTSASEESKGFQKVKKRFATEISSGLDN